jgi:3-hydroxyisobutyrate dehydrogenase-like beta-hydroxyacid dehydrogenase
MAKIAFLGLGMMGRPMSRRLLDAGHQLVVWNRTKDRTAPLVAAGAVAAASPARAAHAVDIAITMLATPAALEAVVFGQEGLAGTLTPGQTLIEMSTIGPKMLMSMAERLAKGVAVIDAPVRGSVREATDGHLGVFAGGAQHDVERVRPILDVFGTVRHVGGPGSGAAMKLVVNATLAATIVALGEALSLGRAFGLDRGPQLDVLGESTIAPTVRSKRSNIEADRFAPNFKLSLAAKDIGLVADAAQEAGLDLREAQAARTWLDQANEAGAGELDYSAVVNTILGSGLGG